jgi:PAS domain S-box-containing protein
MHHSESTSSQQLDQLRTEKAALSAKLALLSERMQELEKTSRHREAVMQVLDKHSVYVITDPAGIVLYANEQFCQLSQYTREELVGKNTNIVNSGYHSEAFWSDLWQTVRQGRVWQGEVRNKARDGSFFWIDMIINPLLDEQGEIERYLAIRKDITLSKQAEAHMRFHTHILSHINEAVVGLDASHRVNFWNHGAERLYGLAAGQVMGKPLAEAYTPVWLHPADEAKAMLSLDQKGTCQVEIIHRLSSGKELYVEATTQVLCNEQGGQAGLLALIRDVTERKKAAEVLNDTLQELEKRNHELDNYVYKVSHDLRAPLTSMQGLLQLIKLESDTTAKAQYLSLIENRVHKLDDYIQSILYHSKMVNAAIETTPIRFDKIIEDCFEELKHYTNWQKIALKVHIGSQEVFCSDAFRITVILKNIITNAIKYMNPQAAQSYLHFDIDVTPQKAVITARDNGIGIEEPYLDKIFHMFFRATAISQGSGLGLYIVKQAIEKLQGSIRVESRQGAGTAFIIELPNLANNK